MPDTVLSKIGKLKVVRFIVDRVAESSFAHHVFDYRRPRYAAITIAPAH
jgi:hypothetical protein